MNKTSLFSGMMTLALSVMMVSCVHVKSDSDSGLIIYERTTEVRHLKGFEKIEINGSPTVYYTQSDSFSVVVEGPQKGVENILAEVKDGTLSIRNRGKLGMVNIVMNSDNNTIVNVSSPDLVKLTLNGSGDFVCDGRIDTDNMGILLKGSGDIKIEDIICDRCQVDLVGSGDIDVNRLETRVATASLIGSGDIELDLWNTPSTSLTLRGSGDIDASFHQNCNAVSCDLRGSGDISLKGEVDRLSRQEQGSGEINNDRLVVRKPVTPKQ